MNKFIESKAGSNKSEQNFQQNQYNQKNAQNKLTTHQKKTLGILSIGTFFEYFDLMLYVHMAVLLNELFFPKTDKHTAQLLDAFTFCSTFVFRPIGALIIGYIGDRWGRKTAVIITTSLMALSCITIALVPTYTQIGILASWIVIGCRVMQGMSSMGEIVGAELYMTESTRPPVQYFASSMLIVFVSLGTVGALSVAYFITYNDFDWRYAFWAGALISLVSFAARNSLTESSEFAHARSIINKMKNTKKNSDGEIKTQNEETDEIRKISSSADKKTVLALFCLQCTHPVWLYLKYIYIAGILKTSFDFSSADIIQRNLFISVIEFLVCLVITTLSLGIYPLKILKFFFYTISAGVFVFSFFANSLTLSMVLFAQLFIALFGPTTVPATSIFLKYFPVLKRFTYIYLIYAISRSIMYVVTSFGLVYLVREFDYIGIIVVVAPMLALYKWGLWHFEKLERR